MPDLNITRTKHRFRRSASASCNPRFLWPRRSVLDDIAMLSIVIPAWGEEPALLDTLASLVHATAEGVVRDVALATPEPNDFLRTVADSAGCELVEGPNDRGALVSRVRVPHEIALDLRDRAGLRARRRLDGGRRGFRGAPGTAQPAAKPRRAVLTLVPTRAGAWPNLRQPADGPVRQIMAAAGPDRAARSRLLRAIGRSVRLRSPMYNRHRRRLVRARIRHDRARWRSGSATHSRAGS